MPETADEERQMPNPTDAALADLKLHLDGRAQWSDSEYCGVSLGLLRKVAAALESRSVTLGDRPLRRHPTDAEQGLSDRLKMAAAAAELWPTVANRKQLMAAAREAAAYLRKPLFASPSPPEPVMRGPVFKTRTASVATDHGGFSSAEEKAAWDAAAVAPAPAVVEPAETERLQQENYQLLWNLGGCSMLATSRTTADIAADLARPALYEVRTLVEDFCQLQTQLAECQSAVRDLEWVADVYESTKAACIENADRLAECQKQLAEKEGECTLLQADIDAGKPWKELYDEAVSYDMDDAQLQIAELQATCRERERLLKCAAYFVRRLPQTESLLGKIYSVLSASSPRGEKPERPEKPPMLYGGMSARNDPDWWCYLGRENGVSVWSRLCEETRLPSNELRSVDRTASDAAALAIFDADMAQQEGVAR